MDGVMLLLALLIAVFAGIGSALNFSEENDPIWGTVLAVISGVFFYLFFSHFF